MIQTMEIGRFLCGISSVYWRKYIEVKLKKIYIIQYAANQDVFFFQFRTSARKRGVGNTYPSILPSFHVFSFFLPFSLSVPFFSLLVTSLEVKSDRVLTGSWFCDNFFAMLTWQNMDQKLEEEMIDSEYNLPKVDVARCRYPYCIVWTPIPLIT